MKKFLLLLAVIPLATFGQIKSSVIKNTADTEVFSINYGSGVATARVAVVEAVTLVGAVSSAQSSVTVSGATGIVSTAAAAVVATNTVTPASLQIRVNGTNYLIKLFLN